MTNEQANAIISLSRTKDWESLMEYVAGAVRELEMSLGYIDCTNAVEISRIQGARNALMNVTSLKDVALEKEAGNE